MTIPHIFLAIRFSPEFSRMKGHAKLFTSVLVRDNLVDSVHWLMVDTSIRVIDWNGFCFIQFDIPI